MKDFGVIKANEVRASYGDMWVPYDPNSNLDVFPRPNLDAIQLRSCFACNGTKLGIVKGVTASGVIQFKAVCHSCGHKSGAIGYAHDAKSMAAFVMPFGKFKGTTLGAIEQMDSSYLDWCLDNMTDEKLLGTILLFRRSRSA